MPPLFKLDAVLDRTTVPVDVETGLKLQLSAASQQLVVPSNRAASAMTTNLCLVFDCSGSMAGQKRETAIAAARLIVDTVHPRHRLSLVGFSDRARVLVDNVHPTPEGKDALKVKLEARIRDFARGTTNLCDGLKKGHHVLGKQPADARVMVILSDGGADSERAAQSAGALATEAGIQLFAVGIGDDYEADALLKLVTPSNGAVFGESDLDRIKTTFEVLIGRIESFVATNASLLLVPSDGVKLGAAYKTSPEQAVIGQLAPDRSGQARLHVGNVEQRVPYGFLVGVTVPPRKAGKSELLRAVLQYDAPSLGLRAQQQEVKVTVEHARASTMRESNPHVLAAFQRARFVEHAEGLADAQRRKDKKGSEALLQQLVLLADERGDADARAFYVDLLDELKERGKISQERINALVLGTTAQRPTKPGPALYDVILVDGGPQRILLVRELRAITGRQIHEIATWLRAAPARVKTLPLADARALRKRMEELGARAEVKRRSSSPR